MSTVAVALTGVARMGARAQSPVWPAVAACVAAAESVPTIHLVVERSALAAASHTGDAAVGGRKVARVAARVRAAAVTLVAGATRGRAEGEGGVRRAVPAATAALVAERGVLVAEARAEAGRSRGRR